MSLDIAAADIPGFFQIVLYYMPNLFAINELTQVLALALKNPYAQTEK